MNAPDLDALRRRWARAGERIDASLSLDVAAMRAALADRTRGAVRAQSPWLLAELALDAALVIALLACATAWYTDLPYLLASLALLVLPALSLWTGLRQWRSLATLDYAAPVLALRAVFERLREQRVRLARAILFLAVPLWWPAVAVALRALFGADLLRGLPLSVHAISLASGAVLIAIALPLGAWLSRRYRTRPGWQDFLDDVAGLGWRRLRGRIDAQAQFEADLALDGAERALHARRAPAPLPPAARQAQQALRRRLLLAILVYAVLIVLTGVFNALHGGQARYIAPAVLVNFAWIAQMVAAILQRGHLGRLDGTLPIASLQRRVAAIAGWSRLVAQRTAVALPLLAPLLLQVLARALAGIDLYGQLGSAASALVVILGAIGSALAWRRLRRRGAAFAATAVQALSLGAASLAQRLEAALTAADRGDTEAGIAPRRGTAR
jgi:hypothetical protein